MNCNPRSLSPSLLQRRGQQQPITRVSATAAVQAKQTSREKYFVPSPSSPCLPPSPSVSPRVKCHHRSETARGRPHSVRHTANGARRREGEKGREEGHVLCVDSVSLASPAPPSDQRQENSIYFWSSSSTVRPAVRLSVRVVRELPRRLKTSDMNLPEAAAAGERSHLFSPVPSLARRFLRLSLVTKTGRNEFRF